MIAKYGFDFFDAYGFNLGFAFFLIAVFLAYFLLCIHDLNRKIIIYAFVMSVLGHFIGALLYYWYSIAIGSDSIVYFKHLFSGKGMFGYHFAMELMDVLKASFLGNSLLGAFFLFGSLGLLGSVYYLLTFKILLDKISYNQKYYSSDTKQLVFPAMILLCWPSYFFWSAGLVKDSFSFLSISMILYCITNGKYTISNLITLLIGACLGFFVRPYLFVIVIATFLIFILLGSKWNITSKSLTLLVIFGIVALMMPMLNIAFSGTHFDTSLTGVGELAIRQQNLMNIGTSFPMPTHEPRLLLLCLPYLVGANLFLPLGLYAGNLIGVISSLENAFLLYWVIFFIRNKWVWIQLKNQFPSVKLFLIFFLLGMSCLGLMCTNLGLAMREKIMYVPALLICICLVYSYRRILVMNSLR